MEPKNKQLLEISKRLLELKDNRYALEKVSIGNPLQVVATFLFTKSTKTFRAIFILCAEGYGQDAMILSRSIFENYVHLAYIDKKDSSNRALLFITYGVIDNYKKTEKIKEFENVKKYYGRNLQDEFIKRWGKGKTEAEEIRNTECAKIIKTFGKDKIDKNSWSLLSLRNMIKQIGDNRKETEEIYYEQVYWWASQFCHPDINCSNDYFSEEENNIIITDLPNDKNVETALILGLEHYFMIAKITDKIIGLNLEKELDDLLIEFKTCVNESS